MSRDGTTNTERFPQRGTRDEPRCRVCRSPLTGRKTSFCGPRCLRDFFLLTDWQRVRRVVYERDGGVCMECGKDVKRDAYHVDHIKPLAAGGAEWDLSNLETLCPRCNLTKGAKYDGGDE